MATVKTVTVKASGGTYTTLLAALAGEAGNLVTLDRQLDIVCDPIVDAGGSITIADPTWTTDATRYIRVLGSTNPNGNINAGYRLASVANFKSLINIGTTAAQQFVRFQNVVLKHTSTSGNVSGTDSIIKMSTNDSGELQLLDCILPLSPNAGITVNNGNLKVRNTPIYGCVAGPLYLTSQTGNPVAHEIYNCDVVATGANNAITMDDGHSTLTIKNTYAVAAGGQIAFANRADSGTIMSVATAGKTNVVVSNSAASDSSLPTGSGNLLNVAYSTATITNVTSGSENFLPPTGSALIDAGADLSADSLLPFTTDLIGATRAGAWDIGAYNVNAPTPVLSSPGSSNVADVSGTLTVTSTAGSSTIYAVLCSTNVAPTNAQIKAGSGGTIVKALSQSAVVGVNTFPLTGLTASTTYFAFFIQNNGTDSNVPASITFTTTAPAPIVSTVSTATPAYQSSVTVTGSGFNATQSGGSVAIGGAAQTITSWSATSITFTVARGTNKYGTALNLVVTNGVTGVPSAGYALTSLQPQSGWAFTNVGTPNADTTKRLTTTPVDLVSGDQLAYQAVAGTGGTVAVATDGSWSAPSDVTAFQYEAWTSPDGWGTTATENITNGSPSIQITSIGGVPKASLSSLSGFSIGSISAKNGFTIQ